MSALPPIATVAPDAVARLLPEAPSVAPALGNSSFASMLAQGLHSMEAKVSRADELVKKFALDDSIPLHQVTYALEEAKLSVELAMQVRTRLLEGYRELMNMQL
jgi:flagellar hook-basal body complex protein FliE